jgi:parvulin-like peptidyl-prolyl isomerase
MLLSLAACGGTKPSGDGDVYDAAFAQFDAKDKVVTGDDIAMTWEQLFFFLARTYKDSITASGVDAFYADTDAGKALRQSVLDDSIEYAMQLAAVERKARAQGFTLTEEQLAALEVQFASYLENNTTETTSAESLLWSYFHATLDEFKYVNTVNTLKYLLVKEKYASALAVTDEQIEDYFSEAEVFHAKHILLMTVDSATRQPLSAAEIAAKRVLANEVLTKLAAFDGDDFDAYFTDLMVQYNEDNGEPLTGYTFTTKQMVSEFENATRDLALGHYTPQYVESTYGYHIIYRLPLDYDMTILQQQDTMRDTVKLELAMASFDEMLNDEIEQLTPNLTLAAKLKTIDLATLFPRDKADITFSAAN